MEALLDTVSVPPRLLVQNDLLKTFGLPTGADKRSARSTTVKGKEKETKSDGDDGDDQRVGDDNKQMDDDDDDSSGEDDDVDVMANKRTRAERTEKRAQNKIASVRLESLRVEALEAYRIVNNSAKLSDALPPQLHTAWIRKSKLTTDAVANTFRGQNMLKWHTWEWATTAGPSRSRTLRLIVCNVIAEHTVIQGYRPRLLADVNGGACFIRNLIDSNTKSYRIKLKQTGLQQTTLDQIHSPQERLSLSWPDGIKVTQATVKRFSLDEELSSYNANVTKVQQQQQLQRIIQVVESQRIAWQDTTNTVNSHDKPPIVANVQSALESLIQVRPPSGFSGHTVVFNLCIARNLIFMHTFNVMHHAPSTSTPRWLRHHNTD